MCRILWLLAVVLPGVTFAQTPSARLVGRVTSADSNRPLVGVTVTLNELTVTSDNRGAFAIPQLAAGRHVLRFEMLGHQPRVDTVTVVAGETTDILVQMATRPVALPPIAVLVRSRWLEMNGYYERRFHSGLSGHYLDRSEIERRNPTFFTDLLRDASGVRVETGFSRRVIRFNREAAGGLEPKQPPDDPFERYLVRLRGCQPSLFIDGRAHHDRIISGYGAYVDDFNALSPSAIDAIEIYVGANTPTEFRNNNGCGVILIWTRRA
ncbi:MAG: TonB-dependent receptor [Gemmatimonadota bacterium]